MSGDSEHSADVDDSFEALLRQAAHVSHVSRHSALAIGAKLAGGRFQITRCIGEGGMGVVYEGFDSQRRSKVALKTLSRLDASGIYRLKNEFRALADVAHPNLVRLHELFADDALWFFTMDLVDAHRHYERLVAVTDVELVLCNGTQLYFCELYILDLVDSFPFPCGRNVGDLAASRLSLQHSASACFADSRSVEEPRQLCSERRIKHCADVIALDPHQLGARDHAG